MCVRGWERHGRVFFYECVFCHVWARSLVYLHFHYRSIVYLCPPTNQSHQVPAYTCTRSSVWVVVGCLFAVDVHTITGGVQWEHYYCIIAISRWHNCAFAVQGEMPLLHQVYGKSSFPGWDDEGFSFPFLSDFQSALCLCTPQGRLLYCRQTKPEKRLQLRGSDGEMKKRGSS